MEGVLINSEPPEHRTATKTPPELLKVIEAPHMFPQWWDWKWQMKNRITSIELLRKLLHLTPKELEGTKRSKGRLAMAITPYFFRLMDRKDPACPIRKQTIPRIEEFSVSAHELIDPCSEDEHQPVHGIVHRYPDRVLLMVTDLCATYCRYCTRKRMVGSERSPLTREDFERAMDYIKANRSIRDVLISGGDPLILSTERLEYYIKRLRTIEHIEIIRIGTRIPVTLPMRIDAHLVNMLKRYHPVYMSIHFSHPKEITPEVRKSCTLLADAGIPLGSQTVLLKGINDTPAVMKKLMHELLKIRVRPYYIYQCDLAMGTAHFRTPVSTGIDIIEKLRGHTTGYAVPTFVIDAPGGGGKIPVGPVYMISQAEGKVILRNYENRIFEYNYL